MLVWYAVIVVANWRLTIKTVGIGALKDDTI
jgi:hypothetical protein